MSSKLEAAARQQMIEAQINNALTSSLVLAGSLGMLRMLGSQISVGLSTEQHAPCTLSPTLALLAAGQLNDQVNGHVRTKAAANLMANARKKRDRGLIIKLFDLRMTYWFAMHEIVGAMGDEKLQHPAVQHVLQSIRQFDIDLAQHQTAIRDVLCDKTTWYSDWRERLQELSPESLPWWLTDQFAKPAPGSN